MPGRQMRDEEGGLFHLEKYIWRSAPATCSLPGAAIRCVVGQDEQGWFRAGTRLGRDEEGAKAQTMFAPLLFPDKQAAIEFSREMTREFIWAEAECYADNVKTPMKPGEQIIRVQMDDGWSVEINARGRLSPLETKLKELSERNVEPASSRTRSHEIER